MGTYFLRYAPSPVFFCNLVYPSGTISPFCFLGESSATWDVLELFPCVFTRVRSVNRRVPERSTSTVLTFVDAVGRLH